MPNSLNYRAAVAAMACAAGAFCIDARSQTTVPKGNEPQESRAAPMGTKTDPPPAHALESARSQTSGGTQKQGGSNQQPRHKPEGAGGFENGLYGTGNGSNK